MLSFWDRDPTLLRAKYCKRHRQTLQISSLKFLYIFKDISSFFPSFASILMESLLHISYDNPVNPMLIPSATFCTLPPYLSLCHSLFQTSPQVIHLLCSQPSEYAPCKLPGRGFPVIWAFLFSLPPKLLFNVPQALLKSNCPISIFQFCFWLER